MPDDLYRSLAADQLMKRRQRGGPQRGRPAPPFQPPSMPPPAAPAPTMGAQPSPTLQRRQAGSIAGSFPGMGGAPGMAAPGLAAPQAPPRQPPPPPAPTMSAPQQGGGTWGYQPGMSPQQMQDAYNTSRGAAPGSPSYTVTDPSQMGRPGIPTPQQPQQPPPGSRGHANRGGQGGPGRL